MFHITFLQIGVFDWLSGRQKGSIFIKMFKNLLLRNHKEDEAETWHTCLGHYPLQKLCFLNPRYTKYEGRPERFETVFIKTKH